MHHSNGYHAYTKVYYRPIEAAIRWSGLIHHEQQILDFLGRRKIPAPDEFPRWPMLRLNTERIFDAIVNRDLPCGKKGITSDTPPSLDDPWLTVRHVDLRMWMVRYYPAHKPSFLFSHLERELIAGISVDAIRAVLADRAALKAQLEHCKAKYEKLHREHKNLVRKQQAIPAATDQSVTLSSRSESAYLNIIGGVLSLLLGQSPAGRPYSTFRTQESVISALIAHHDGRLGISERTLQAKFAAANRHLSAP
jgi:hypothetical protein